MASLTHVCMWSESGWQRITAEQAARLHPGGTVSAHSGLFMCELCGQYVTLTDGKIQTRHFRHSASEASKSCPERTFGANYFVSYSAQEHDLPIRITEVSASSFRFEIGLIRAPIHLFGNDFRIEIRPKGIQGVSYLFSKERLNCDSITYLPIGENPFEEYVLSFQNGSNKLYEFWSKEIRGIVPEGTLFERPSGKKLPYDADVELGKEYYLLKRGYSIARSYRSIEIQEVTRKRFGWEVWTLYVVSAHEFNEEAARFYLNFHCRLTEHPISLKAVWPLYVEGNYVVKHSQKSMYVLVEGNISSVKTFPEAMVCQLNHNASQAKLFEISCNSRQQLISVGRSQPLEYTYFWRESLNHEKDQPRIVVTDLAGAVIPFGEATTLPYKKTLVFQSQFDGEIIISHNNRVLDKQKLLSDKQLVLDGLSYGVGIQVVTGLDIVWDISFKKQYSVLDNDGSELLKQVTQKSGKSIPIPHSLRNILIGMSHYPQICQWIRKCIRDGSINEQSYRRLQDIYCRVNTNR